MLGKILKNKLGQNTVEYAMLFGIVVGALTLMSLYQQRGLQAKIKDVSDSAVDIVQIKAAAGVEPFTATNNQYQPYYIEPTTDLASTITQEEKAGSEIEVNTDVGGHRVATGGTRAVTSRRAEDFEGGAQNR